LRLNFLIMSLFDDVFLSISKPSEGVFKDRGSRFIGLAFPVKTEDEVKEQLLELRKSYHDARHHCYAYRLGWDKQAWRVNDDGEPSGTAGKPIYGQILSQDLTNILIVVIRYFGGTKLGVSGLINAYKTAAQEAIASAEIIENTVKEVCEIHFEYGIMNDVMKLLKDFAVEQKEQDFDLSCRLVYHCRKTDAQRLYDALSLLNGLKIRSLGLSS